VTEHVLLDRASAKIGRVLHRLTEAGIGVALDDFGTGYASLSHLRRFPVGCLKIDRSFVEDVDGTVGSGMIARTIIALANGLGLQTIAEGVETEVQRAALQAAGCTGLQGYLIARPMAPAAAAEWLAGRGNAISGG
jgi:EAL domain-containing protein (putative c-di-GMP-specific phosphodiesterase class I)